MLNKKAFAAAVATQPAYIEDVFSTFLYTGNGSTQTINNGIDLSTKGGLVWFGVRSSANGCSLYDTSRGANNRLRSWTTGAQDSPSPSALSAFNSNGFSLGSWGEVNATNTTYVSWTFAKQANFFDVQTFTTNASGGATVSHALGSTPGCVIIKSTGISQNWFVYHRGLTTPNNYMINLNTTAAEQNQGAAVWSASSSAFTINNGTLSNSTAYVAYIFAHNAGGFGLSGTENVISCGSYTGNGSSGQSITLGFETQFVIVKAASTTGNWKMYDVMRGQAVEPANSATGNPQLQANTANAEVITASPYPTATGFNTGPNDNANGETYIYIAIRRGPMRVPTSGTQVYNAIARTGTGAAATVTGVGFAPDLVISRARTGSFNWWVTNRLRGPNQYLNFDQTSGEGSDSSAVTAYTMDGFSVGTSSNVNQNTTTFINYALRRAPCFFDEVCYTGTGSNRTVDHNLKAVPELMIVKRRDTTADWQVYYGVGTEYMVLNSTAARVTSNTDRWNSTAPTSSVFSLGTSTTVNASGGTYVNYLFSSCTGVSKVGTYTGTGTTLAINCGFTGGARFVLIKRTDSTGDWHVWDTARGIVSGNDPYLLLNSTAAEVTTTDWIDPVSTGFELSSTAPAALNANGGTYIYLAIA